ncbi:unnamed protein product [Symbiodinium microadriaticum]|nr:unnamed protein product [Symbiodinium microadriaticum]
MAATLATDAQLESIGEFVPKQLPFDVAAVPPDDNVLTKVVAASESADKVVNAVVMKAAHHSIEQLPSKAVDDLTDLLSCTRDAGDVANTSVYTVSGYCLLDTVTEYKLDPAKGGRNPHRLVLAVVTGKIDDEFVVEQLWHLDPSQEAAALEHFAALLAAAARVQGGMLSGAMKRKDSGLHGGGPTSKEVGVGNLQELTSAFQMRVSTGKTKWPLEEEAARNQAEEEPGTYAIVPDSFGHGPPDGRQFVRQLALLELNTKEYCDSPFEFTAVQDFVPVDTALWRPELAMHCDVPCSFGSDDSVFQSPSTKISCDHALLRHRLFCANCVIVDSWAWMPSKKHTSLHGGWAEYRKQAFFRLQNAPLQPLKAWQKRAMVASFSFFETHSVPQSPNDWMQRTFAEAVPRREEACVICARLDYIGNRFEAFLFAEPDGTSNMQCVYGAAGDNDSTDIDSDRSESDEETRESMKPGPLFTGQGKFCFGPAEDVHKILDVERYVQPRPSESAEVEKGLQGNTVMISQPQMTPEQILPSLTNLLDSLVCDPLQFWGRSQGLQRLARVTPRVVYTSADAAASASHEVASEDSCSEASGPDAAQSDAKEQEGAKAPIGLDYLQDAKPARLFEAMQAKLKLLQQEAYRLVRALDQRSVDSPDVEAAGEERVRHVVVGLQETVRQLQRSKPTLLEASVVAELSTAVKIPGQSALSCSDPLTWPSCFVEVFYGDCVPNLPDRPNPNVTYQDLFSAWVQREELQYNLETDTAPYRAKLRSRFDTPEFVACFADTVRRLKTMQMVSAAFRRPGFEQDVKCISEAKTEDFLQAAKATVAPSASSLLRSNAVPKTVQTALRHLMLHTATVPLTDGIGLGSGFFDRDDDWASSATPGLSGMVVAAFEPLEAQGRGFQHGHRKVRGRPAGIVQLWKSLMQNMLSAEHCEDELRSSVKSRNENLLQAVSSVQYESALLPAKQFGINLSPEPFSLRQQQQTRFNGKLEKDGKTLRPRMDVVPSEPLAHIVRGHRAAALEQRETATLPLTGSQLASLPHYRLPQRKGSMVPLEDGCCSREHASQQPGPWPCLANERGEALALLTHAGTPATLADVLQDAQHWEASFVKDFRRLNLASASKSSRASVLVEFAFAWPQQRTGDKRKSRALFLQLTLNPLLLTNQKDLAKYDSSTDCTNPLNFAVCAYPRGTGTGNRKAARSVQTSSRKAHEPVPQLVASGTSNELPELPNSKTRFFLLWATANQLLVTKHGRITGHILSCLCEYLGIPCGCHPAQLHIEEFVALEADEVSRNFNLQSLAKSKPLKNAPPEHANVREEDDSDQLDVTRETKAQVDVVVGELESDFEDMDDLYQAAVPESPHVQFSLEQCKSILARSEEIERCSRKGRHRESDMQMKQFAAVFGGSLQMPQSQVPSRESSHYSLSLRYDVGRLSLYRNAMAKLLRKDIDRHDTSHETIAANLPADVAVAELSALLGRNDHRERLVQKAKRKRGHEELGYVGRSLFLATYFACLDNLSTIREPSQLVAILLELSERKPQKKVTHSLRSLERWPALFHDTCQEQHADFEYQLQVH